MNYIESTPSQAIIWRSTLKLEMNSVFPCHCIEQPSFSPEHFTWNISQPSISSWVCLVLCFFDKSRKVNRSFAWVLLYQNLDESWSTVFNLTTEGDFNTDEHFTLFRTTSRHTIPSLSSSSRNSISSTPWLIISMPISLLGSSKALLLKLEKSFYCIRRCVS